MYVRINSSCNSNFVFNSRRFSNIRLQKWRDLENRIRGPSRSLEMSPCDRAHTNSSWRSIVTVALPSVVSEIFNVEKCRDLEIGVRGHSRLLKVVLFDRLCIVSYQCYLVTLSLKRTVFEIFDFKYAVTFKTSLEVRQGHWKYHHSIERIRLPIDVL